MLELDRVRRSEEALIARVSAFGRLEPAKIFASKRDETAWVVLHYLGAKLWKTPPKFAVDSLPDFRIGLLKNVHSAPCNLFV